MPTEVVQDPRQIVSRLDRLEPPAVRSENPAERRWSPPYNAPSIRTTQR